MNIKDQAADLVTLVASIEALVVKEGPQTRARLVEAHGSLGRLLLEVEALRRGLAEEIRSWERAYAQEEVEGYQAPDRDARRGP